MQTHNRSPGLTLDSAVLHRNARQSGYKLSSEEFPLSALQQGAVILIITGWWTRDLKPEITKDPPSNCQFRNHNLDMIIS